MLLRDKIDVDGSLVFSILFHDAIVESLQDEAARQSKRALKDNAKAWQRRARRQRP